MRLCLFLAYIGLGLALPIGSYAQAPLAHDLAVTNIYTLDKLAQADDVPHAVRARVVNQGQQLITNATVRLRVRGANTLNRTVLVSLAAGQETVVSFPTYTPGALGRQRLSVRVPTDDNAANDSVVVTQAISPDTTSYITPGVPNYTRSAGGCVWQIDGAVGSRFTAATTARRVVSVRTYVRDPGAAGLVVEGFVADPVTGCVLGRSARRLLTPANTDNFITLQLADDVVVQNQDYLAGLFVVGRAGPPLRCEPQIYGGQFEWPLRTRTVYSFGYVPVGSLPVVTPADATGFRPPTDTLEGRFSVEIVTAAPPACPQPANLYVTVRGGPFRVAFDSAYSATGYEVAYGPAGFDPNRAAATGGQVVGQRNSPFWLNAPLPDALYEFYARSRCAGAVGASTWVGPVQATSPCAGGAVFQFPYREPFDVLPPGQPWPCGTQVLDNDGNRATWQVVSAASPAFQMPPGFPPYPNVTHNAPNALFVRSNGPNFPASGAADDWFFTPLLALRAGQTYRLSFWYRNESPVAEFDKLAVWLGDAPDPARQTGLLFRDPRTASFSYLRADATSSPAVRDITVPADGFYCLGFQSCAQLRVGVPGNGTFLLLDDIEVNEIGPTPTRAASAGPALSIYPNPAAAGRCTLAVEGTASTAPLAVRVTDALGRVVYQGTARANTRTALDLSAHPAGVYAVQVCGPSGCTTRRLLLE